MPSDKTKNVLKGFGAGANVALQGALSRSARPAGGPDISDGEPVQITTTGGLGQAPNPLSRAPIGAFVVNHPNADTARKLAVFVTDNEVQLRHDDSSDGTFTVWVF